MAIIDRFKKQALALLPRDVLIPDLVAVAVPQFPLDDFVGGKDVPALLSLNDPRVAALQNLNTVYSILKHQAFDGLADCDAARSRLSLYFETWKDRVEIYGLRGFDGDGAAYFCANLDVIKAACTPLADLYGFDADTLAPAMQKALIAYALQNEKPVLFIDGRVRDTDKAVIYAADRWICKTIGYDRTRPYYDLH